MQVYVHKSPPLSLLSLARNEDDHRDSRERGTMGQTIGSEKLQTADGETAGEPVVAKVTQNNFKGRTLCKWRCFRVQREEIARGNLCSFAARPTLGKCTESLWRIEREASIEFLSTVHLLRPWYVKAMCCVHVKTPILGQPKSSKRS